MSAVSRVLDRCRLSATSVNQLNQAIIALENIITPDEALSINNSMAERANPETNVWAARESEWRNRFDEWSTVKGFSHRHKFVRVWNKPSATLYRTTGFSAAAPRRLVVLFTGGMNRMMVPSWIFLGHFPRRPAYVLMVRSGWTFYDNGLPGLTKDFPTTVDWIRGLADDMGLTVDTVMGSSAASYPALRAGFALGARRRLLFGLPQLTPEVIKRYHLDTQREISTRRSVDRGRGLTLIAGGEDARDIETSTQARHEMPRLRVVIVDGSRHNVVEPLARGGKLHRLLRKHS
jgi:hypothetical protein